MAGEVRLSSSYYYKIGTWNVISFQGCGKLCGVIQELEEMKLDVIGVSELGEKESSYIYTKLRK